MGSAFATASAFPVISVTAEPVVAKSFGQDGDGALAGYRKEIVGYKFSQGPIVVGLRERWPQIAATLMELPTVAAIASETCQSTGQTTSRPALPFEHVG